MSSKKYYRIKTNSSSYIAMVEHFHELMHRVHIEGCHMIIRFSITPYYYKNKTKGDQRWCIIENHKNLIAFMLSPLEALRSLLRPNLLFKKICQGHIGHNVFDSSICPKNCSSKSSCRRSIQIQSLYAGDAGEWTRSNLAVIPLPPEEHAPTGCMGFSRIDTPSFAG